MTTQTPEADTLQILKQLAEEGVTPGEELKRVVEDVGGEIIERGSGTPGTDDETPPMVSTKTEGGGYTTVYHTETGLDSKVTKNMLPAQLRVKLPSGKLAFTIYAPFTPGGPTTRPVEGTIKCYMHKDSEMRSICDEFGFVLCPKDNISSAFDLRQHMVKRHTQEWRAFEERRTQKNETEDRGIQRRNVEIQAAMLETMQKTAGIEGVKPEAVAASQPNSDVFDITHTRTCSKCDHVVTADTEEALSPKMGGHTRKAHPKQKHK